MKKTFDIRELRGGVGLQQGLEQIASTAASQTRRGGPTIAALAGILLQFGSHVTELTHRISLLEERFARLSEDDKPKAWYVKQLKDRNVPFDGRAVKAEIKELYEATILAEHAAEGGEDTGETS